MGHPNLGYIDQLAGDDEEFREKLVTTIKKELPLEIAEYKKNADLQNFAAMADNVHKLKHKISVLGMEKSYYLAEAFEKNLRESSIIGKEAFEKVLADMEVFVQQL